MHAPHLSPPEPRPRAAARPAPATDGATQRRAAPPRVAGLEAMQRRANAGPHAAGLARTAAAASAGPAAQLAPSDWLRRAGLGLGGLVGGGLGWKAGALLGSVLGPLGSIGGGLIGAGLGIWGADRTLPETEVASMERAVGTLRGQTEPEEGLQAWTDARLEALDALEHRAYAWMDEHRDAAPDDEFRTRVNAVMDAVQAMHVATIRTVHRNDLDLWTPDRGDLTQTARRKLDRAWNRLRGGTGLVRTQGTDGTTEADDELRAMHARILSRGTGRELLYTHLDLRGRRRNKNVTISFTEPDRSTPEQREQVQQLRRRLQRLGNELKALQNRGEVNSNRWNEIVDERRTLLGDIDELGNASDAASARPVDGANASVFGDGSGSDSRVQVRQGTRDSLDTVKDRDGNVIPAPAWLQYAHELIHALHFRAGEERSMEEHDRYRTGVWTDKEEYQTIHGLDEDQISENRLREEHGLTLRWGH